MHRRYSMTLPIIAITAMIILGGLLFVFAPTSHAQVSLDLPTSFAGFSTQNPKTIIENIVKIVLGFVGIIFVILILYAGIVWMTSGGEPDKINRAKKIIASAVIGLIIVLSAYSLASYIGRNIQNAVSNNPNSGNASFGFALGAGILESHYPARNAVDVPRNTNIIVTFKEPINPNTVCNGAALRVGSVRIEDTKHLVTMPNALDTDSDHVVDNADCTFTSDHKSFKFNPGGNSNNHLGVTTGNVPYQVTLTSAIQKESDNSSALPLSYIWVFTVSSVIDETPPTVINVYPKDITVPRNTLVQITFSEAVDPTTASGIYDATPSNAFDNIRTDIDGPPSAPYITGSYMSANQYRTTEFVTNDVCGQNSCGGAVYCLPGPVSPNPTQDIHALIRDTVTDMAGNQLDGSLPAGPGGDYSWQFKTNGQIDLVPPVMILRTPKHDQIDVNPLIDPVESAFNKRLSATSINTQNVGFGRDPNWTPTSSSPFNDQIAYWVGMNATGTKVFIYHDAYTPLKPYHPGINSGLKDVTQNCYYPAGCDRTGDGVADPGACRLGGSNFAM